MILQRDALQLYRNIHGKQIKKMCVGVNMYFAGEPPSPPKKEPCRDRPIGMIHRRTTPTIILRLVIVEGQTFARGM